MTFLLQLRFHYALPSTRWSTRTRREAYAIGLTICAVFETSLCGTMRAVVARRRAVTQSVMQAEVTSGSKEAPPTLARARRAARALNFLLTNRMPRRWATLFMGRFSRIENPLVVRRVARASGSCSRGDLRLARGRRATHFRSLHECFTRELKPGARPIAPDPNVVVSPCDAIVGACGRVDGTKAVPDQGLPVRRLRICWTTSALVDKYRDGRLRDAAAHVEHVSPLPRAGRVPRARGDLHLRRHVERESDRAAPRRAAVLQERARGARARARRARAIARARAGRRDSRREHPPALLAASRSTLEYRGPNRIACDRAFAKGEEMGYFEHGSTIIVFASERLRARRRLVEGRDDPDGRAAAAQNCDADRARSTVRPHV